MTFANFPTTAASDSASEEPSGLVATFTTTDDEPSSGEHLRPSAFESLFGDVSPIRSPATDVATEVQPASSSSRAPVQISLTTSLLDNVTFAPLGEELPRTPATSTISHSVIEPTDNLAQPKYAHHSVDMLTELAHSCNWCFRQGDVQCTLCHKHFCSDHGTSGQTTSSTSKPITPLCFLCRSGLH